MNGFKKKCGKHVYTVEYYSNKKEWNNAIYSNRIDLEFTIQSEVSQEEKDKYCISLTCGI